MAMKEFGITTVRCRLNSGKRLLGSIKIGVVRTRIGTPVWNVTNHGKHHNDKAEQPPGFFGGLIEPLVMRNRRQKGIYDSDTRHVSRRNRQVLLKVYIDVYGR